MNPSCALQVVEYRVLQEYREQSTTALRGGDFEVKVLERLKVLKGFTASKVHKGSTFSKLLKTSTASKVLRKFTASPQRCLHCSWSLSKNETH